VSRFVQLLERRYGDGFNDEGDELLSFAQIDRKAVDRDEIDLAPLVDEVADQVKASVDHEVNVHVGEVPTVRAKRGQLGRVLRNLLSNAARFHDGPPANVTSCGQREDDEWVIHVEDDGIGIDPE